MRFIIIVFLTFIIFADASAQIEPVDTDGNGLRNISSPDNILFLSLNPSYWEFSYELDNDIDLVDSKSWNEGLGFLPIGNEAKPFTGIFDGHNFIISNLTINRPSEDNLGFFGITASNADIRNVKFTVSDINGNGFIGIIVGRNFGELDNIYANGTITAKKSYVGGITGENSGTIQYCRTNIKINGSEAYNGGVAGENYGSIYYSRSLGEIRSAYIIGGLVGDNSGLISNCYSRVNIFAVDNYIGGLAGSNWETGNIINSYSTGEVKGSGYYQGGLVGFKHNSAKDSASFWDTEASDIYESVGGEGKTTSEMKDASTFMTENWDFTDVWAISSTVNGGYPYLKSKTTSTQENEIVVKPIISFIPNINNESINIDIHAQNNSFFSLSIYDYTGSIVMKNDIFYLNKGINKIIQNVQGLSAGVYLAVIELNESIYIEKFIIY
ncbi:MAG: GLUG motif-containing protein [bacterium]